MQRERSVIDLPDWLVGSWEGQPDGALMRADSDAVAIRLADTFRSRPNRTIEVATPIHVNASQIREESWTGDSYFLITRDNVRLDATLQSDGTMHGKIDDFTWIFTKEGETNLSERRLPRRLNGRLLTAGTKIEYRHHECVVAFVEIPEGESIPSLTTTIPTALTEPICRVCGKPVPFV